jgi:membrane-associated phospholipid phosphatase
LSRFQPATSTAAPHPPDDWARALGRLWWHRQLLKIAGICAFTAVFFQGYFHVLHNPRTDITVMPLTPLDHWIGVQPAAFWPYVSLWFYVGIAPALLPSMRALLAYGGWVTALCLTGLACFWLWPTAVPWPVPELNTELNTHPGFALLRGLDAAGNACPSLHVGTAMFTALWVDRQFAAVGAPAWTRLANAGWLLLIAWSTVATRQHVVLDVLAGAALGAAFAALSLRYGPDPKAWARGQPVSSAPI